MTHSQSKWIEWTKTMNRTTAALATIVLAAIAATAFAAPPMARSADDLRWGVRLGLADDPDQGFGGAHVDLGEVLKSVTLRPHAILGFGDDHTVLAVGAPLLYHFDVDKRFSPFAGGGLEVGFVDKDLPRKRGGDDTDFEIALVAAGGIAWHLKSGRDFFAEINLGFGDLHDARLLVGWMF